MMKMVEPLINIIEREGGKINVIEVGGRRLYSTAKAAELAQVSRNTMFRWARQGYAKSLIPDVPDTPVKAYRDKIS